MSHSKIWPTNLTGAFPFIDELFDENGLAFFGQKNSLVCGRRKVEQVKEYGFNPSRIPLHLRGDVPTVRPEI